MNEPKEIIEIGLGSIGRLKIMRALAEENKFMTIYTLHKKTRLKREHIKANLDELVRIGWVIHKMSPNSTYGIDQQNHYSRMLVKFFKETGYLGEP
jgi:phage gp29-like protein